MTDLIRCPNCGSLNSEVFTTDITYTDDRDGEIWCIDGYEYRVCAECFEDWLTAEQIRANDARTKKLPEATKKATGSTPLGESDE